MRILKISILSFLISGSLALAARSAEMPPEYYTVEEIKMPQGVAPEIGGLSFNSKGELVVITRRSGIWIGEPSNDPNSFNWRPFDQSSMHNPMGVLVENDNQLLVPQMAELTRITDSDGDGMADSYEAVSTAWGVSGNYHETVAGPVPDGEGNWFLAIGTASHNGPTFDYVRGEFSRIGRRGRNYSASAYKGWVVKIAPDGKLIPWASGFRANNGIALSPEGDLWVTDNQGDWRGTSPIFHVEEGHFYGHPSSLVWDTEFFPENGDPLEYGIENLEALRTRAAVLLPQGDVCNSPAEPVFDTTGGAFGPFAGQMFVGDIAGERILRVMLEKVNGNYQGAAVYFINRSGLRGGNNRFTFSPDGKSMYVGQTYRGWGRPAEGIQRITWQGKTPLEIQEMHLTRDGFAVTFTKPLQPALALDEDNYEWQSYHYSYGHAYGSEKLDQKPISIAAIDISDDLRTVTFRLTEMTHQKVYQLDLSNLASQDGLPLINDMVVYTVNELINN